MTAWVIRDARLGDRSAVLSFWPHPDRFDRRLSAAATGAESLLVATRAEVVAGIVSIRWGGGCDDPERPLLYALAVRPDQRRTGAGTALIRQVAHAVTARGFPELTLEVEPDNTGAIRLYRRLGFTTIGPHHHVWQSGILSGTAEVLIMHADARTLTRSHLRPHQPEN